MKKVLHIVGTLSLFVAACSAVIVTESRSTSVTAHLQEPNDARKEKLERLKIEKFVGEAASLRAKQLRKKNKAISRAMKDAEKAGLRSAFDQGAVILATDQAPATTTKLVTAQTSSPLNVIRPVGFRSSSVQDTYSQDGYEITFIPYDDGDPNTWEGIIYRNGPDIDEDTRFAVLNIETENVYATREDYYPPDGGDPQPQPVMQVSKRSAQGRIDDAYRLPCVEINWIDNVTDSQLRIKAAISTNTLPQACPPGQHRCIGHEAVGCCGRIPPIDNWARRSVGYCTYAAGGCLRRGPGWGACFAAWCGSGMVYALFW